MKFHNLIFILGFIIFFSCQSKYEKLQGHWHAVITEEQPYFNKVDVIDTMVFVNAHSIAKTNSNDFLFYSEEYPELQFYDNTTGWGTENFYIENDTLYVNGNNGGLVKYIKHDLSKCRESHFFEDLMIEINLNECGQSSINLETAKKLNYLSFISIGKPKYDDLGGMIGQKIQKDSTIIQVADILMYPSEIPKLIFEEKDKLDVNERLGMFLIIDKSASTEIIDSVFSYLNPDTANLDLYKACFNSKIREVEYVKIKERNDLH